MCLGGASAPQDNSGAIAAQQAAQTQATIQKDLAAIDNVYGGNTVGTGAVTSYDPTQTYYNADGTPYTGTTAPADLSTLYSGTTQNEGQFTPDYYNNIGTNYTNYYDPQLSTQYQNSLNSLTYQLGQQGILQSTEGARQLALLQQQNQTAQQGIASGALSAENSAKQQVANQRSSLTALANTAADPSAVASQVSQSAASAVSPVQYSPLANAFTGLLGQGTNAIAIQSGALPTTGGSATSTNNPTFAATSGIGGTGSSGGGSGNATVVNQ